MIKERDVVRLKLPYPSMSSDLAVQAHMYICYSIKESTHKLIKVQRFKPYMICDDNPISNYIVVDADINSNPFKSKSVIDLDKLFTISNVTVDERLCADTRRDISEELFSQITTSIKDDIIKVSIDENELISLNYLVTKIS